MRIRNQKALMQSTVGSVERNVIEDLMQIIFRQCGYCDGVGKIIEPKEGSEAAPVSVAVKYMVEGKTEINVIKCSTCSGRGVLLTYWGEELATIVKQIPEMVDEIESKREEQEKKMKKELGQLNQNQGRICPTS